MTVEPVATRMESGSAKPSRQTLSACFEAAQERFKNEITSPLVRKDPKRGPAVASFLKGSDLESLRKRCEDLDMTAGGANNAAQLLTTLDQFKGAADVFLGFAPESISIIWFGISSLITIANARVQTRLLICETCDSIANIIADCMRWEKRIDGMQTMCGAYELDIWSKDIPDLIFKIFDFLWNAMPHMDQSRAKRLSSTVKDLFTQELQQKVCALLEKHKQIVETAKAHFEESVFRETLQTSLKIDRITKNIQQYISVGRDILDALQKKTFLEELDRLRDGFQNSFTQSSQLHFSTLTNRVERIEGDRGGRLASSWIFREEAYVDWKADTNDTTMICIRGPRGHGKSVAMMSVQKEILTCRPHEKNLICHFFFKKGEQEMQRTLIALKSLLYQLLSSKQLREDVDALLKIIQILNPTFGGGESAPTITSIETALNNVGALCNTIRLIAVTIPGRVYIMLDALDECLDRREQDFAHHLKSLAVATKDTGFRVIISARDSIDIENEFNSNAGYQAEKLPEQLKFIEITAEKNSADLKEYLTHDVGEVLKRQIDKEKYESLFNQKLEKVVSIVHKKARGDFTLARMVIANLQQPSKNTFEKRITQLPSAIGEIYMASLESLTPDEQEFVVNALRWTVWTVSSVTVLELSDHYRELYKYVDPGDTPAENNLLDQDEDTKLEVEDPRQRPEIKEVIYHIKNAGRDFFRYDDKTGIITVDISIREWIQEDMTLGAKSATKASRGFNKYRDPQGNTVFNFVLTPSFVRYGDNLSELFIEREAHRTIAINILHALNSESFQKDHMSWAPDTDSGKRVRYEIQHWHDHIRILQKWWTKDCLDDSWWAELLTQLSIFMRPENWYIWILQYHRPPWSQTSRRGERLARLFDSPLHLACELGLSLIIDLLVRETNEGSSHEQAEAQQRKRSIQDNRRLKTLFMERAKIVRLLLREGGGVWTLEIIRNIVPQLDADEWEKVSQSDESAMFMRPQPQPLPFRNENDRPSSKIFNYGSGHADIWNSYDTRGRVPLHIAARSPKTVRQLIEYGADINKVNLFCDSELGFRSVYPPVLALRTPLLLVLIDAEKIQERGEDEEKISPLIESASILVSEGASLSIHITDGTLLHHAAKIRNLRFFKLLCVFGNWDVHTLDRNGMTPLHCLFTGPRPKNAAQVEDSLEICRILVKMDTSGKDLVNAEDCSSKNALAYAVERRLKEAVELLISLGADIHDLDHNKANCFHHLAYSPSTEDLEPEIAITESLIKKGLDIAKQDSEGRSPLDTALRAENWGLAKHFLSIYKNKALQGDINILLKQADYGSTLFHHAVDHKNGPSEESFGFFKHLATELMEHADINKLLLQLDERGNTALHYALRNASFDALKYIVDMKVFLGTKDFEGFTILDLSIELVFELLARSSGVVVDFDMAEFDLESRMDDPIVDKNDGTDVVETANRIIQIFNYLLENTPASEFSFSFFGATLFHILEFENDATIADTRDAFLRLNLGKLFLLLSQAHPTRDIYGWTLFDALSANDLMIHANEPIKQIPSELNDYAAPTDMLPTTQPLNRVPKYTDTFGHNQYTEYIALKSRQPIQPLNKTFYFEVSVKSKEDVPHFEFRIGLYEECNFGCCAVTYGTDGLVKIGGKLEREPDS
ncbi:hypothetical protein TWF730_008882 [Orbilia blumenaviensis]|uniref:Nephrocystin 3-like N-terminal domain-containing protein n=1 Tax=Orbilia blumenaviensis TaxID=1796055 RepID=A0AAV9V6C2_9PEZI